MKKRKDPYQPVSSSFFDKVYEVVRQIPRGRVSTYGAIAETIGSAGSSRMVGWAMNASHLVVPPVPAHRVVNRNGMLTGKHFFGTSNEMQELLEQEGIEVREDKVLHFKELFWHPGV
jgi:methylated-DNA-protein-cysteine methyltransferase-like protein